MSARVDPTVLPEIRRYGAFDANACFNCGNCTAVCPLSTEEESFPRKMIRYAQVGMKNRLLSSKELWLCYYCGECSATCPRQAEPGEFMAAARRFAIASYDCTGLATKLYKSKAFTTVVVLLLGALSSLFLVSFRREMPPGRLALFEFVPEVYVQILGFLVFGVAATIALVGTSRMLRSLVRTSDSAPSETRFPLSKRGLLQLIQKWWPALWDVAVSEILAQRRYRTDECEEEHFRPLYLRKWVVHAAMLYGFLGLFAATALDFLFKPVGSWVPPWYPMRLLGNVSGLLFMYGTTVAIVKRLARRDKYSSHSHHSDWTFLFLLWVAGLTGFLLEFAVYLPASTWGYALLIIHVSSVAVLGILLPFTKFAHVLYRTIALILHTLRKGPGA